ncbi:hypothetical protein FA95DRAFT_1558801 [Auriscalpium vulgare]|uniref:Uncharacterized protein n=1 Tax=Auriscalpium vulgare TaxID=40419 RepID=A0ACB8RV92_9AGAM|nr:hypothetical protein FA95DRAFT_1558801 [Auriscalpium vulgare]
MPSSMFLRSDLESDPGVLGGVGALLIGSVIAAALSGVTCYQTSCYFDRFPKDRIDLKIWVALIMLFDVISTVGSSAITYDFFVKHYGDMYYSVWTSWAWGVGTMATSSTVLLVQLFFISRIWQLRQVIYFHRQTFNKVLRMVMTFLALYPCGVAFVQAVYQNLSASIRRQPAASKINWKPLDYSYVLTSTALDMLITAALIHILRQQPNEFPHIRNPFARLTHFFITRGVIMGMYQIIVISLPFPPPDKAYAVVPVLFCVSKVFANSALITLNNRRTNEDDTIQGISRTSIQITLPSFHLDTDGDHFEMNVLREPE